MTAARETTPIAANDSGHATPPTNAQSGVAKGTETEVDAPGISTDKKAEDTKTSR